MRSQGERRDMPCDHRARLILLRFHVQARSFAHSCFVFTVLNVSVQSMVSPLVAALDLSVDLFRLRQCGERSNSHRRKDLLQRPMGMLRLAPLFLTLSLTLALTLPLTLPTDPTANHTANPTANLLQQLLLSYFHL